VSSPLETLRALSRSARPQYEINEINEINEITPPRNEESPLSRPDEGLNSLNSFLSLPGSADERERLNSLNSFLSLPTNADDLDERAALVEYGANVPRRWAEGFAALCLMPAPTGFTPKRWRRIIDAAGTFMDRWTAKAAGCGWRDLDVFGVDADRPDARFDAMGLVLLLDRMEVVGIDPDGADLVTETGTRQRYRRRPLPANTVSLWALGRDD